MPQVRGSPNGPLIARGTVFETRSDSGHRRIGDPGLAGVLVSNGRDVTRSDAEGRWQLPVLDGDSVFVIKPPGWATLHGPDSLPRFSYLHQPLGSPHGHRHAGVAATGPLPGSIDFALKRQPEKTSFEAVLLSDTQPENETELAYLRDDIIVDLIGRDFAFGVNHGDVVADDLSLYPRYLDLLGTTGLRWHHCPGNHDLNWDAIHDRYGRETWKRVFGPRHYAFQHGQATFILLDNVHYSGRNAQDTGSYSGRFGDEQLNFVRNLLAHVPHEQLIVVSMHIPLVCDHGSSSPSDSTADRQALLRLLSGRPHTLSLSGHMHTTEHHYLGADAGFEGPGLHHHHVLTAASGSWWCGPRDRRGIPSADSVDGTPNGMHVLSVDGNRYTTRFVPASGKSAGQLRIVICGPAATPIASPIPSHRLEGHEIVANVFDGGPRTAVTCEIKGSAQAAQLPMHRVSARDPFVERLLSRQDAVRKPWVEPVQSTHVWKAQLPLDLSPGSHRVTVRAVDEYGRRHAAHAVIEVGLRHTPNAI